MTNHTNYSDFKQDVIVIGTGMGGATLGYQLAKAGKKVLFCEKGRSTLNPDNDSLRGNYAEELYFKPKLKKLSTIQILKQSGRCYEKIEDRTEGRAKSFYPFAGCGTGGSGALYGMVMQRFWPEDFFPKSNFPEAQGTNLPESWPIDYEQLRPYYCEVEQLFKVKGELDPFNEANLDSIPKRAAITKDGASFSINQFLKRAGLHPFQPPLACDLKEGCKHCQGFLCDNDCKKDPVNCCLKPAIKKHNAQIIDNCKVVKLIADEHHIKSVLCEKHGEQFELFADCIVLAAGALESPNILLNSKNAHWPDGLANSSGMVGKNLMRNFYDLYFVFPKDKAKLNKLEPKEIYFTDFYGKEASKLGIVQSFGHLSVKATIEGMGNDLENSQLHHLVPLFKLIKPLIDWAFERWIIKKSYILVSTMEDMPYLENRIMPSSETGGAIAFKYTVKSFDRFRIQHFREVIKEKLKGQRYFILKSAEDNKNFIALTCGTCRFGNNPKMSVLDQNNQAHGIDNLFIVDSSFFPSNPGLNSGMTVAANALRIADHILS